MVVVKHYIVFGKNQVIVPGLKYQQITVFTIIYGTIKFLTKKKTKSHLPCWKTQDGRWFTSLFTWK
tara:strand:- start:1411 stop:1608 length:198 start_codon:yes stop_codon:yes gene_type:complete